MGFPEQCEVIRQGNASQRCNRCGGVGGRKRVVLCRSAPGDRAGWLPSIAIKFLPSNHIPQHYTLRDVLKSIAPSLLDFSVLTCSLLSQICNKEQEPSFQGLSSAKEVQPQRNPSPGFQQPIEAGSWTSPSQRLSPDSALPGFCRVFTGLFLIRKREETFRYPGRGDWSKEKNKQLIYF